MNPSDPALPVAWTISLCVLGGTALLIALYRAPWRIVVASPTAQHLFGAATLVLIGLWLVRAGITPGLSAHFLGATALTLLVGWPLAIVATLVASVAIAFLGVIPWTLAPAEFVVGGVLPVAVSHAVRTALERLLPANLFVYLLGCGFFGAVLAGLVSRGSNAAMLMLSGAWPPERVIEELGVIVALLTLPEGVINGMIVSVLTVYRPAWVKEFDDRRYLD
ncbi:MAG: energy-coupling factor ABC transporter permease [Halofilum sp. (in: g-proteobacteria)]|nr:energy-coupling factor ABC transporter permease [Halofilum sp. (in: g-proteobacteria)]